LHLQVGGLAEVLVSVEVLSQKRALGGLHRTHAAALLLGFGAGGTVGRQLPGVQRVAVHLRVPVAELAQLHMQYCIQTLAQRKVAGG